MIEEESDYPVKLGNKAEGDNCMKREMLVRKYLVDVVNKIQETGTFD